MHRRQTLCALAGGIGLFSGCLSQAVPSGQSAGLTIEYKGISGPQNQRAVIIMVTEPSTNTFSNVTSRGSVELSDETALFYQKYELKPGDTVHPDVFVTEPGEYRLDVWVEQDGTIGGNVQIGEDGSLTDASTITITSDGTEWSGLN